MVYTAIHEVAANGARIGGTVKLVGGEDEPFAARPWFAEVTVDSCPMAHAFHETRADADRWLTGMVGAYQDVHSRAEEVV